MLIRRKISTPEMLKSLEALVQIQAYHILRRSLDDYMSLFQSPAMSHMGSANPSNSLSPKFTLSIIFSKKTQQYTFEPSIADVKEAVVEAVELIFASLQHIPKFTEIFKFSGTESRETAFLYAFLIDSQKVNVQTEPLKVENCIRFLQQHVSDCFEKVTKYLEVYQKYVGLFSSEVYDKITCFLEEDRKFEDYVGVNLILKFRKSQGLEVSVSHCWRYRLSLTFSCWMFIPTNCIKCFLFK